MRSIKSEVPTATENEADPSNMRILLADILTFDGLFGAKFDILKPRWLLTIGIAAAIYFCVILGYWWDPENASPEQRDQAARRASRRDGWHKPISSMLILMGADNHYRTVGVAHDLLGIRAE